LESQYLFWQVYEVVINMSLSLTIFSLRRPVNNKKINGADHAVDRFNHATDRRFGCSLCLIATIGVSSQFGALGKRPHKERI
jgi:hypothetical protein